MTLPIYLKKDDQRLPDFYGIKIEDITGKVREYKVASHSFIVATRVIEIITFDDEYVVIPLDNVIITFDREFSKIVRIKAELEKMNGTE